MGRHVCLCLANLIQRDQIDTPERLTQYRKALQLSLQGYASGGVVHDVLLLCSLSALVHSGGIFSFLFPPFPSVRSLLFGYTGGYRGPPSP